MKRQQCSNCMFSSWYHNFKHVTFKSKIINLSPEFIHYLNADGIILPDSEVVRYSNDLEGYSDDDEDTWNTADESSCSVPSFPELKIEIDNAINDLGGSVFPKLNWSCPKDAAWISHNGTLKCTSFNDICLLLKSSDFITHDLTKPYEYCEDTNATHSSDQYELVLRRWCEVMPGMEFRCFIKQNKLVGISQRHHSSYFDYLPTNKQTYLTEIINFYNSKIKGKFADFNYVFDIYKEGETYQLVDFNPFGKITDSLLFSWSELDELDVSNVDEEHGAFFRVITGSDGIQPSPYNSYAIPKDMIDLKSGEDINKMMDFFNLRDLISKPGEDEND